METANVIGSAPTQAVMVPNTPAPTTTTPQAPTTPTPSLLTPASKTTEDAKQSNWYDSLKEDYRNDKNITKYKTMDDLAKGYIELSKKLGHPSVPVPQEGWTNEQWNEFYGKLGRPETPDQYEFQNLEIPEGMQLDAELDTAFKQMAHEHGLTKKQASALRDSFTKMTIERNKQEMAKMDTHFKEQEVKINSAWGNDKDFMLRAAEHAISTALGEDGIQRIQTSNLDKNADFVILMGELGKKMQMQTSPSVRNGMNNVQSSDAARYEIESLKADPSFTKAYLDPRHPEHESAKHKMNTLLSKAYSK
jgi:hypothetical protein